ncbi:MAG: tetratricopeptide repeat protein [Prevotella sp.]|nr:tetratricopeptide repeat protein [Prevotella sp.]
MAKQTGDEYFDSDEFRELLSDYEQAVNTGQPVFMDADELAEIADYYQMEGRQDEADRAINLALSLSPGAVAPLTYKIHEALFNGDTVLARSYLDQIIERDDPEFVYNQAEILLAERRDAEADEYLRQELKKVPDDEYQDYVIDVANIYADYGISDKAMEWMARAKPEDSAEYKEIMARTLFGLGKYEDSERLWGELIDGDPFSKHYWNALASTQFMKKDYSGSVQSSEFAIAIDPEDPEGIIAKANALYHMANYEQALEYFKRYSDLQPDDEFALLHQGTCLINMGRYQEAEPLLKRAEETATDPDIVGDETSPYLADIYMEQAFTLSALGRVDEAIDALDKTEELDCDHVQVMVVKGHVLLGAERFREAERQFRKAVAASDDTHATLVRIVVSFYDNKYVEQAYRMFNELLRSAPKDFDQGYAYMALCCYDLERWDEFLEYLKKACEVNPTECQQVLGHLFPEDVEPKAYYDYITKKMRK